MSLRQAAQQALEALALLQGDIEWTSNSPTLKFVNSTVAALRAALAEPEQPTCKESLQVQEPVAYFDPQEKGFYWAKPTVVKAPISVSVEPLPLYSAPTPRKPEQEPVAWYLPCPEGADDSIFRDHRTVAACTGNNWTGFIPLYTAPTPRKPVELTDGEITDAVNGMGFDVGSYEHRLARAVIAAYEAKQGEQT